MDGAHEASMAVSKKVMNIRERKRWDIFFLADMRAILPAELKSGERGNEKETQALESASL